MDLIAAEWTESRPIANYREHRTFTGRLDGVGVTCCSTGAGGGSTSSAFEELAVLGADTFIRVGTTGALQAEIECGDLIISTAAMRQDGTSQLYVDPTYPAAAHYAVTAALVEAAERLGSATTWAWRAPPAPGTAARAGRGSAATSSRSSATRSTTSGGPAC